MREKIVGIIGGMGPEATVDLMARIIKVTPAVDDVDHIRMIVDNNPKVPSRIKALIDGNGESPIPYLQEMARRLESWGVDFLAMPCNTAHHYHLDIQKAVTIKVLNMVDLTVESVIEQYPDLKRAGLLASTAVIRLKLFERPFTAKKVIIQTPSDRYQMGIMHAIKKIKTSNYGGEVVEAIQLAADDLVEKRAEVLLVACTEISIISKQIASTVRILDSAQILAESIVRVARNDP